MKEIKDVFKAFLIDGAIVSGYYGFPVIPQDKRVIPDKLLDYDCINKKNIVGSVVSFYIDSKLYDGFDGIWNSLTPSNQCALDKLKGSFGIIEPDYDVNLSMPKYEMIYNLFRSKSLAYYLYKQGYYVIPNVRWTTEESYEYAFDGISKNSVIAIRIPLFKSEIELQYFIKGFIQCVYVLEPYCVLIKGKMFIQLEKIIEIMKVNYRCYD